MASVEKCQFFAFKMQFFNEQDKTATDIGEWVRRFIEEQNFVNVRTVSVHFLGNLELAIIYVKFLDISLSVITDVCGSV
jgi:hypothetical protein